MREWIPIMTMYGFIPSFPTKGQLVVWVICFSSWVQCIHSPHIDISLCIGKILKICISCTCLDVFAAAFLLPDLLGVWCSTTNSCVDAENLMGTLHTHRTSEIYAPMQYNRHNIFHGIWLGYRWLYYSSYLHSISLGCFVDMGYLSDHLQRQCFDVSVYDRLPFETTSFRFPNQCFYNRTSHR